MPLTLDTPNHGRAKTLRQTGQALFIWGSTMQPLRPDQVYRIEQRALRKLRLGMEPERGSYAYSR